MKKVSFKKKVFALAIFIVVTATIVAQEETGVVINGVTWATRNVDAVGTFAESPESQGKFYQWNSKNGRTVTVDTTAPTITVWEAVNDPSPDGWRVPTRAEINKLLDTEKVEHKWTTESGVSGRRFIDKSTGASIFLPTAKYPINFITLPDTEFVHGHYWSSNDANGNNAFYLYFCIDKINIGHSDYRFPFSIRPVKDVIR